LRRDCVQLSLAIARQFSFEPRCCQGLHGSQQKTFSMVFVPTAEHNAELLNKAVNAVPSPMCDDPVTLMALASE